MIKMVLISEKTIRFLSPFLPTDITTDPLPIKVHRCSINREEATGQGVYWAMEYLYTRRCPLELMDFVLHHVFEQIIEKITPEFPDNLIQPGTIDQTDSDYEFRGPTMEPLTWMHSIVRTVDELLLKMKGISDDAELEAKYPELCRRAKNKTEGAMESNVQVHNISYHSMKNQRRSMEDKVVVFPKMHEVFNLDKPTSYFAVFDGHNGIEAAAYCAAQLHQNMISSLKDNPNMEEAITEAYRKTDAAFLEKSQKEKIRSGTTVVAALIYEGKIYVSWCGDCKAIFAHNKSPTGALKSLVIPHKPDQPAEEERIQRMGGEVLIMNNMARVNGALAVTRAIGDLDFKECVISKPEIFTINADNLEPEAMVLASDGLWDTVTPNEVQKLVEEAVAENEGEDAAERLASLAKSRGSQDNIAIVIVYFKSFEDFQKNIKARVEANTPYEVTFGAGSDVDFGHCIDTHDVSTEPVRKLAETQPSSETLFAVDSFENFGNRTTYSQDVIHTLDSDESFQQTFRDLEMTLETPLTDISSTVISATTSDLGLAVDLIAAANTTSEPNLNQQLIPQLDDILGHDENTPIGSSIDIKMDEELLLPDFAANNSKSAEILMDADSCVNMESDSSQPDEEWSYQATIDRAAASTDTGSQVTPAAEIVDLMTDELATLEIQVLKKPTVDECILSLESVASQPDDDFKATLGHHKPTSELEAEGVQVEYKTFNDSSAEIGKQNLDKLTLGVKEHETIHLNLNDKEVVVLKSNHVFDTESSKTIMKPTIAARQPSPMKKTATAAPTKANPLLASKVAPKKATAPPTSSAAMKSKKAGSPTTATAPVPRAPIRRPISSAGKTDITAKTEGATGTVAKTMPAGPTGAVAVSKSRPITSPTTRPGFSGLTATSKSPVKKDAAGPAVGAMPKPIARKPMFTAARPTTKPAMGSSAAEPTKKLDPAKLAKQVIASSAPKPRPASATLSSARPPTDKVPSVRNIVPVRATRTAAGITGPKVQPTVKTSPVTATTNGATARTAAGAVGGPNVRTAAGAVGGPTKTATTGAKPLSASARPRPLATTTAAAPRKPATNTMSSAGAGSNSKQEIKPVGRGAVSRPLVKSPLAKTAVPKSTSKAETANALKGKVAAKQAQHIVTNGSGGKPQENGVSGNQKEEQAAGGGLANGNHEKSVAAEEEQVKVGGIDNGAANVVVEDLLGISTGNGGSDQVMEAKEEELVALADVS